MCCLTVKRDLNMEPHWYKKIIVVLGNNGDQYWAKNEKFPTPDYNYGHLTTEPHLPRRQKNI